MVVGPGWAVALAGIFIAQAGKLVAAADAIAVAGFRRCLDGNERHRRGIVRFPAIPCKRSEKELRFEGVSGKIFDRLYALAISFNRALPLRNHGRSRLCM